VQPSKNHSHIVVHVSHKGHQPGTTSPNVSSRGGGKFQCPTESNRSVDDNDKYFFIQSEHFED